MTSKYKHTEHYPWAHPLYLRCFSSDLQHLLPVPANERILPAFLPSQIDLLILPQALRSASSALQSMLQDKVNTSDTGLRKWKEIWTKGAQKQYQKYWKSLDFLSWKHHRNLYDYDIN